MRSVWIRQGNVVAVEFDSYGSDEGGAYFVGTFDSLGTAVASIEQYLGRPLREWKADPEYPEATQLVGAKEDGKRLAAAIQSGTLPLPSGGEFRLKDSYWSQFVPLT
ncbi:MAG: hypothetical protein ACYC8T_24545 [Myxococcaceae bacterium]